MEKYRVLLRETENYILIYETMNFMTAILDKHIFYSFVSKYCAKNLLMSKNEIDTMFSKRLIAEAVNLSEICTPPSICISLTDACNLKCSYCYSIGNGQHSVYSDILLNRINENENIMSIMLTGGEPLSWPHLHKFLSKLDHTNKNITIATNGTLIKSKIMNCSEMINLIIEKDIVIEISLDSNLHTINDSLRGCTNDVLNAIDALMELGIRIRISTVISMINIDYLNDFATYLTQKKISNWTLLPILGNELLKVENEIRNDIIYNIIKKYKDKINISYNNSVKIPYSLFAIDTSGKYSFPGINSRDKYSVGDLEKMNISEAWTHINKLNYFKRYEY